MTLLKSCPYCDNAFPYYLSRFTMTKKLSTDRIIELTDKVIALEAELATYKKTLIVELRNNITKN